MMRNLTVIWAPLLLALLLTTVQTEKNINQQQQHEIEEELSNIHLKKHKPQSQQKHSNAIMGEAGVTNSPMVDNPLAANNHYYYGKNNNRQITDDINQYDAPDDCHFAPFELSGTAITTTTTLIPITTTSSIITTLTSTFVSPLSNNDNNNNHNNYYQQHEDITLTCNLRTVNSEFDTTNFSVIPAEHTLGLNILCNNEIMAKSALELNSFSHLLRLRELTLKYCKFSKLPELTLNGLTELRNLTVNTFNILWPTLNFDIEAGAFNTVKQLQRLDLSTNNIWTLPAGVFCTLPALIMLNVSFNSLQDINELGFREFINITKATSTKITDNQANKQKGLRICNLDLEILDCSRNNFVLLPAYGFSALKRLRILLLQHNEISMLAKNALSGLKNLQIFNVNSNNIAALRSELFQEQVESIQEIYLANNSISVLTPNIFANLKQLQALDLSFNKIISTWINNGTFVGLIRLVSLNLSHNRLTNLTNARL